MSSLGFLSLLITGLLPLMLMLIFKEVLVLIETMLSKYPLQDIITGFSPSGSKGPHFPPSLEETSSQLRCRRESLSGMHAVLRSKLHRSSMASVWIQGKLRLCQLHH